MMGVPQSRWGYSEVLRVHTYVPPKTPRQAFFDPAIYGRALSESEGHENWNPYQVEVYYP